MKAKIYSFGPAAAQQMKQARVKLGQVALVLRYGRATQQTGGATRHELAGVWVQAQANHIVAVGRGQDDTKTNTE